jgi:hypothetical protein
MFGDDVAKAAYCSVRCLPDGPRWADVKGREASAAFGQLSTRGAQVIDAKQFRVAA